MTCVVGLVDSGKVYLGADSRATSGTSIRIRSDEKVFVNNGIAIGFSVSFRMGQILKYKFTPPPHNDTISDIEYISTVFIDSIKKAFIQNGYGRLYDRDNHEHNGQFLVGYKGCLYTIYGDFQVAFNQDQYDAIGLGADIALGSIFSTVGKPPMNRIELALQASEKFNNTVGSPFFYVNT